MHGDLFFHISSPDRSCFSGFMPDLMHPYLVFIETILFKKTGSSNGLVQQLLSALYIFSASRLLINLS